MGRGLPFYSFAVLHDGSPDDHKLPASACTRRRELTFSNQSTNCRKWNTRYGCSFVEIAQGDIVQEAVNNAEEHGIELGSVSDYASSCHARAAAISP